MSEPLEINEPPSMKNGNTYSYMGIAAALDKRHGRVTENSGRGMIVECGMYWTWGVMLILASP